MATNSKNKLSSEARKHCRYDGEHRNEFISEISKAYSRRLLCYFNRMIHSQEDAEDLVQETYYRLCTVRNLGEVRNVEAFLFTTAYRLAVDLIRRQQRTPIAHAAAVEVDKLPNQMPCAEDYCSSREELLLLFNKVRDLPPRRQRTFILRKFQDMSYQDIAEEMGVTIGSVRKHLSAAVSDCRAHLLAYQ